MGATAAVVGGVAAAGAIGAGASMYAANKQADAAEQAAESQWGAAQAATDAQRAAYEKGLAFQKQMYKEGLERSTPWYLGGVAAQNQLLNLMGLGSIETANTATGTAPGYMDPAVAAIEAQKIRDAITNQLSGQSAQERELSRLQSQYEAAQRGRGSQIGYGTGMAGYDDAGPQLASLMERRDRALASGNMDVVERVDSSIREIQPASFYREPASRISKSPEQLKKEIEALQQQINASKTGPQYSFDGISNPEALLKKMSDTEVAKLFSVGGRYGPTMPGTDPVYGPTGEEQAQAQVEALRTGILGQMEADRTLPAMESKLSRLKSARDRLIARGRSDMAARYDDQIKTLQTQVDAAKADNLYDVSGLGPNYARAKQQLRKLSDTDLYKQYKSPDEYTAWEELKKKAAELITPGTPGGPVPTPDGTTPLPADTSQKGLQKSALEMFQTDPGYLFRLTDGEKAIMRNRAATGGAQSGATLKALERYAQGVASDEYANYYNRLAALAGQGQTQNQSLNSMGYGIGTTNAGALANLGNAQAGNILAAGQARASGYINAANAQASGWNNLAQSGGYMSPMIGGLFSGGGGYTGGWVTPSSISP